MKKQRGYIRSEDLLSASKPWQFPDYTDREVPRENAINYDPVWSELDIHAVNDHFDFSDLTAQALDEIRQSAIADGLKEGKAAGFSEGQQQGFAEGREAGFAEGKQQGHAAGLAESQQLIEQQCQYLQNALSKLSFPTKQVDHQLEVQIVAIICEITKAVLKVEVETNPKVILQTLQDVVAIMPLSARSLTIYLHPEDIKTIEMAFDEQTLKQYDWKLLAEPNFTRGDIQVVCKDSSVNFTIEQRVSEALSRFMAKNHSAEPKLDKDDESDQSQVQAE